MKINEIKNEQRRAVVITMKAVQIMLLIMITLTITTIFYPTLVYANIAVAIIGLIYEYRIEKGIKKKDKEEQEEQQKKEAENKNETSNIPN